MIVFFFLKTYLFTSGLEYKAAVTDPDEDKLQDYKVLLIFVSD